MKKDANEEKKCISNLRILPVNTKNCYMTKDLNKYKVGDVVLPLSLFFFFCFVLF